MVKQIFSTAFTKRIATLMWYERSVCMSQEVNVDLTSIVLHERLLATHNEPASIKV